MGRKAANAADNGAGDDGMDELIPASEVHRYIPPPFAGGAPEPETEAERRTGDLLDRMGGEDDIGTGYVTIHRTPRVANTSEEFVEKVPSDRYTYEDLLSYLRESYGPGEYRMRLYIKQESGRHAMKANRTVLIAAKIAPTTLPAVPAPRGSETENLTQLVAVLIERSDRNMDALMQRLDARSTSGGMQDFLTGLAGIATALSPFIVPVLQNRRSGGDEIDKLAKLIAINKGVADMAGTPSPAAPQGTSAMDVLVAGLQALPTILAMRQGQTARPALPAATADSATVVQAPTTGAVTGQPNHPLYPLFTDLVTKAATKVDPDQAAADLANLLKAASLEQQEQFVAALQEDTFMAQVVQIQPDVLVHIDWFVDLRMALLDILLPDDEHGATDSSGTQHGDADHSNPGNHP